MAFIRTSLLEGGEVCEFRLSSLFENRSVRRILQTVALGLGRLLALRPAPLQSLLFFDGRDQQRLLACIRESQPDAVYFDSVRAGMYTAAVRRAFPALRLVCDFDDLMSARMDAVLRSGGGLSPGYLRNAMPGWIRGLIFEGPVARALPTYEGYALAREERRIATECDAVVLVSSVEVALLQKRVPQAEVVAVPPPLPEVADRSAIQPSTMNRFVFIGSDGLLQNRLTIEYLVELWRRLAPPFELHIFGKQSGRYAQAPGLVLRGFAASLADVYAPGSVLLAPAFLAGGVKTKVLEAMAHGVIVVGTRITFEGIDVPLDGICYEPDELEALVARPEEYRQRIEAGGRRAIAAATRLHDPQRLAARWRGLVWPASAGG